MTLHLLNRSPQSEGVYRDLREAFGDGDHLLLIEDGCYAALSSGRDAVAAFAGRVSVLKEDLVSRGLEGRVDGAIEVVDMQGFVDLTEIHQRSVSWF
ncbi:sulfurtransferase complex subunit TusB [Salinicola peritrichatus]|uniref:sulfurtransferase complex subunit TusB n=1 Tax=Salinicola peritrichatus TaxID=1267424 RepID=UPI000DA15CC2|nr:sulfurtransferase complex subunit TusB [Salinicola peritrichatus]